MLTLVGHPNAVNPDLGLRAEARKRGWPVHDFRSGRKVTMIALPIAAGAGAVAGGMAAGAAVQRRRASRLPRGPRTLPTCLLERERPVNDLVSLLRVSQPAVCAGAPATS